MHARRLLTLLAFAPFLVRCGGDDAAPASSSGATGDGGNPNPLGTDGGNADGGPSEPTLPARSPGCTKPAQASPAVGEARTVDVGGKTRSFVLYVPKGYDPNRAYPVVTVLHGIGATGAQMAQFIQMQIYAAGNAIVAFPDALNGQWDTRGDVDLAFFDGLMKNVQDTLCVNQQKVFVLGFSFGAYMANHLGCKRASVIRAIIPADGGFVDAASGCGKVTALVYHRREDDNEPIAKGIAARDKWLGINGCASTSTPVNDFGFAGLGCVAYDGCPEKTPVLWCEDTATSPYKHDLREPYRVPMWNWFAHF
jgi:poly(3-hydroxybutyrate) depolymerase